jgi:hypothetical protein
MQQLEEKDYYKIVGISNSSLSYFNKSPYYFYKRINGEIEEEEKKRYLELGKQVHMYLLEPELFHQTYAILDFEAPKSQQQLKFAESYVKASKKKTDEEKLISAYSENYVVTNKSDDKILEEAKELKNKVKDYIKYLKAAKEFKAILSWSSKSILDQMKQVTNEHIKAKELLFCHLNRPTANIETFNEFQIIWQYPEISMPCKSMIDRLVIDHENKVIQLIDIKTTSSIGEFKDKFEELSYYRQLAYYWIALHWYAKENNLQYFEEYKKETYIVALQTTQLVECRVFDIDDYYLNLGLNEIEEYMRKIKWHIDENKWEHTKEYYLNNGVEKL